MERQGSGFKKITEAYHKEVNFRAELEPKFYSDAYEFRVTLYNLNYSVPIEEPVVSEINQSFDEQKPVVSEENQSFETLLSALKAKKSIKETIVKLYRRFGFNRAFARADIMEILPGRSIDR